VLVPTGQDPEDFHILDYGMEEINEFAFNSLNRRLNAIGVALNPEENGGGNGEGS
jgi:hypothetical protein